VGAKAWVCGLPEFPSNPSRASESERLQSFRLLMDSSVAHFFPGLRFAPPWAENSQPFGLKRWADPLCLLRDASDTER
jgi:hypothetical protein